MIDKKVVNPNISMRDAVDLVRSLEKDLIDRQFKSLKLDGNIAKARLCRYQPDPLNGCFRLMVRFELNGIVYDLEEEIPETAILKMRGNEIRMAQTISDILAKRIVVELMAALANEIGATGIYR